MNNADTDDEQKKQKEIKLRGIYEVNMLITLCLVLIKLGEPFILTLIKRMMGLDVQAYLSTLSQSLQVKYGIIILISSQYMFLLIPTLVFIFIRGFNNKISLRLNKISFKMVLLTIALAITMWMLATNLNIFVNGMFSKFFSEPEGYIDIYVKNSPLLLSLFAFAITPAICEELLFRGVALTEYGKLGSSKAMLFTALIFGIMHCSIHNFIGPFVVGIVAAYVVQRSNSLYSSLLIHSVFNSISVFIYYFASKTSINLSTDTNAILGIKDYAIALVIIIFMGYVLKAIMKAINSLYKNDANAKKRNKARIEMTYKELFMALRNQPATGIFLIVCFISALRTIG